LYRRKLLPNEIRPTQKAKVNGRQPIYQLSYASNHVNRHKGRLF